MVLGRNCRLGSIPCLQHSPIQLVQCRPNLRFVEAEHFMVVPKKRWHFSDCSCLQKVINMAARRSKIQTCSFRRRELNRARSKPDAVDRPVRTAHTFVHHYNSTQYCSTETFLLLLCVLKSRPLWLMWHNLTSSQHLLITFGKDK